jgi:hypothetical protein
LEADRDIVDNILVASFEAFAVVMFQVEVFSVVTPGSVVVGFQRFGGSYCLHLQGEMVGMGENGTAADPDWKGAAFHPEDGGSTDL